MSPAATADHAGVQIHFDVVGAGGEPLVMLPGLGQPGRAFGPLIDLLAADRQVIVVDPRGSGRSDAPDVPYTGELVAGDVCAVLDAAGVPRADVLGLSMGGCIAQELAIRHPQRVRALVLLSTLARPDLWFDRILGFRRRLTKQAGLATQLDLALCLIFSPTSFREHADLVERTEAAMSNIPPSAMASFETAYLRQLDYVLAHDAAARLGDVEAPALVVVGEHDQLTTPLLTRELADALRDARHVEIERGSHMLCLEQPQRVADVVREFLAERA